MNGQARGQIALGGLGRDLALAFRGYRRAPGFFLLAVAAIALGIAATSAVFSILNAVLLRPLPSPNPDRLVVVWDQLEHDRASRNLVTPGQYIDWRASSESFETLAAYTEGLFNLSSGNDEPRRVWGAKVTGNMFDLMGTKLAAGRPFDDFDLTRPKPELVVLLSQELWRRHFGESYLAGQSVLLNNVPHDIIGILPETFFFPGRNMDLVVPLPQREPNHRGFRRFRFLTVVGKLQPGVSSGSAQQELANLAARLGAIHPSTDAGHTVALTSLTDSLLGDRAPALLLVFGAAGALLLIACTNVAGLLLARGMARRKEMAIRLSLGAGRSDLTRQVFCESMVICFAGATLAFISTRIGLSLIIALGPQDLPRLHNSAADGDTLVLSLILALVSALALSAVPVIQLQRQDHSRALRDGDNNISAAPRSNFRGALVITEVAITVLLAVGAGLVVKELLTVQQVELGFRTSSTIAMDISLTRQTPPRFKVRLLAGVTAIPGIRAAGLTSNMPLSGETSSRVFSLGSKFDPTQQRAAEFTSVTPGYFKAMDIHCIRGRVPGDSDIAGSPLRVAVNEAFVRRFLADDEPLAKQLVVLDGANRDPWQIIGVVNDVPHARLDLPARPEIYVSLYDKPWPHMTLVLHTSGDPRATVASIREVLRDVDPTIPLANINPLEQLVQNATAPRRFDAFLITVFSLAALALTSVAVYGVTSYAVAQRSFEVGVRMALGARRSAVILLIVLGTLRLVAAGGVLGILLCAAVALLIRPELAAADRFDPSVYAPALIACAVATSVATVIPALRVLRRDPLAVLRG